MEEIWKDCIGYEGLYQVSDLGRVKSMERQSIGKNNSIRILKEKILECNVDEKGYKFLHLWNKSVKKRITVHRLVAQHFIENPNGLPQVNHKDGVKSNNVVYNLEWCTSSQNIKHAYDTGLKFQSRESKNKGINNPNYKHGWFVK